MIWLWTHLFLGKWAKMNSFDEIHQVLNQLVNENKALNLQTRLLDSFVAVVRSSANQTIMKESLQRILSASLTISQAENGSIFLFDNNGGIREKIFTKNDFSNEDNPNAVPNVLDTGLAGWVIRHRTVGCIEDTQRDDRWIAYADQRREVRSALAVPIQRRERLMGLITLQHSKPYKFGHETVDLMQATADQIALVLENIGLYAKLEDSYRALNAAKEKVDEYSSILSNELNKGRTIQKEFFPERSPDITGWRFRSFFKPAMQLSGDFYDIFQIHKNHVGVVIADVCDKGVGAALYMALFRSLLRIFSGSFPSYSMLRLKEKEVQTEALKTIRLTNDYIVTFHDRMATFATIFFGIVDTDTGEFSYINAGHDPPVIFRGDGDRETLMPTGPVVGAFPDVHFKIKETCLRPGDLFFGYTDGVTDAVSPTGKIFGKKRLEMLMERYSNSARDFERGLKARLFEHIGDAAQTDDITFLVVQTLQKKSGN